jgi:hypothetical protein
MGWIVKLPCALPVSCPSASRLAHGGLSLHGLVRVQPFSSKKPLQAPLGVATRVKGVATLGPVGQWTVSYRRNPRVQPCGAEGPKNPSIHHEGAIDSIET